MFYSFFYSISYNLDMLLNIFLVLGISVGLNMIFFFFAWLIKSDVFTDITYSTTFLLTTLIILLIKQNYGIMSFILLGIICLWSIRLGSYLLIRIWKIKVDHRFDKMRNSFWKFGGFWLLQGFSVWIINMQSYLGIINDNNDFNFYSILFLVAAIIFLLIETISDLQKWNWINKQKGKFINRGLWKISRHPNYFGEVFFWWMISGLVLLNNHSWYNFIGFIGPLWITIIIYFISGVPILEKRSFKKYGNDKQYLLYLKNTATVIPFIGKKGLKSKWKS